MYLYTLLLLITDDCIYHTHRCCGLLDARICVYNLQKCIRLHGKDKYIRVCKNNK